MEQVLKIIYDYSYDNNLLDIPALQEISEIIIDEKKLKFDVLKFEVKNFSESCLAYYERRSRKIVVYYYELLYYIKNRKFEKDINFYLNDNNDYLKNNLIILFILLHEFTHAEEYKMSYESSIKKEIISLENLYMGRINKDRTTAIINGELFELIKEILVTAFNYNSLYKVSPLERFANIDPNILISDMLEEEKLKSFFEIANLSYKSKDYMLKKGEVSSPIKRYAQISHIIDQYNNIKFDDLSYKERLYLGLPISKNEYDDTIKMVRALKKSTI